MKFQVVQKTIEDALAVTAPRNSTAVDVGTQGGDSIAFVMVASGASTPNTATITLQKSLDGTSWIAEGSAV